MEDHPKIEAQIAVAPLIGDRLSQLLYILKATDGRLNTLDLFSAAALNVRKVPDSGF